MCRRRSPRLRHPWSASPHIPSPSRRRTCATTRLSGRSTRLTAVAVLKKLLCERPRSPPSSRHGHWPRGRCSRSRSGRTRHHHHRDCERPRSSCCYNGRVLALGTPTSRTPSRRSHDTLPRPCVSRALHKVFHRLYQHPGKAHRSRRHADRLVRVPAFRERTAVPWQRCSASPRGERSPWRLSPSPPLSKGVNTRNTSASWAGTPEELADSPRPSRR